MKKDMADEEYQTGVFWEKIQWMNQRLREECDTTGTCRYMEAASIFMDLHDRVNPMTMADGLHPTSEGLGLWGPAIVETVNRMLS